MLQSIKSNETKEKKKQRRKVYDILLKVHHCAHTQKNVKSWESIFQTCEKLYNSLLSKAFFYTFL